MRDTFVRTLLEIAKKDKNVYLITGDLGFGVLKPFWDELPDQIINAGIAEQNMITTAAGLWTTACIGLLVGVKAYIPAIIKMKFNEGTSTINTTKKNVEQLIDYLDSLMK